MGFLVLHRLQPGSRLQKAAAILPRTHCLTKAATKVRLRSLAAETAQIAIKGGGPLCVRAILNVSQRRRSKGNRLPPSEQGAGSSRRARHRECLQHRIDLAFKDDIICRWKEFKTASTQSFCGAGLLSLKTLPSTDPGRARDQDHEAPATICARMWREVLRSIPEKELHYPTPTTQVAPIGGGCVEPTTAASFTSPQRLS